jgi:hypothetical protein
MKIKYSLKTCMQFLESIQFLSFPFVYSFLNNQIFPSHRDLLEKLTVPQIFKPVTCSYPKLDKDKSRLSCPHYVKLILLSPPFTSRSSKSLIPSGFPNKHLYVRLSSNACCNHHSPYPTAGSTNYSYIALQLSKISLQHLFPLMQGATFCTNFKYFYMFLDGKWEEQVL